MPNIKTTHLTVHSTKDRHWLPELSHCARSDPQQGKGRVPQTGQDALITGGKALRARCRVLCDSSWRSVLCLVIYAAGNAYVSLREC